MIAPTITLGTVAKGLIRPGTNFHYGYIQNTGSVDVRLSFDGVSLPTASEGYILYAGQTLWLPDYVTNAIVGIATSATTTIEVGSDDLTSAAGPFTP